MGYKYSIEITVDKEIIDRTYLCGLPGLRQPKISQGCAFAVALREVFPDAFVTAMSAALDSDTTVQLPKRLREFVNRFDSVMEQALREKLRLATMEEVYSDPIQVDLLMRRMELLKEFGDGEKAVFKLGIPAKLLKYLYNKEVNQLLEDSKHLKLKSNEVHTEVHQSA